MAKNKIAVLTCQRLTEEIVELKDELHYKRAEIQCSMNKMEVEKEIQAIEVVN